MSQEEPKSQTNVESLFKIDCIYQFHLTTGINIEGKFTGVILIDNKWVINIIESVSGYLRRIKFDEIATWTDITETLAREEKSSTEERN